MNKYERARDRIDRGLWIVDPLAGEVRNRQGRRLGSLNWSGYTFLSMAPSIPGGSNQNVLAHRVVWEHVHGAIPAALEVNHKNGIKTDNRLANPSRIVGGTRRIQARTP